MYFWYCGIWRTGLARAQLTFQRLEKFCMLTWTREKKTYILYILPRLKVNLKPIFITCRWQENLRISGTHWTSLNAYLWTPRYTSGTSSGCLRNTTETPAETQRGREEEVGGGVATIVHNCRQSGFRPHGRGCVQLGRHPEKWSFLR